MLRRHAVLRLEHHAETRRIKRVRIAPVSARPHPHLQHLLPLLPKSALLQMPPTGALSEARPSRLMEFLRQRRAFAADDHRVKSCSNLARRRENDESVAAS